MSAPGTLEARLDALLADPLAAVLARGGATGRAIGYVGGDVPLELLLASGRPFCHLPWRADRATPRADEWLESGFPGWARSMLQDWAEGCFDGLGDVVFTRGDDAAQRLYYYVCELQRRGRLRGPRPHLFDIAHIPREESVQHTAAAIRSTARQLGGDDAALAAGIATANRERERFAALERARAGDGPLFGKLARASLFADLSGLLAGLELPRAAARRRVLLAGSVPPDERLHRAAELDGWSVCGEMHDLALTRLGPRIDAGSADPALAIAGQAVRSSRGPRSFADPACHLMDEVARVGAQAVVLWLTREDEARAWHVPAQRAALAAAGVPALVLAARRWDAADGATDEIAAFVSGLAT